MWKLIGRVFKVFTGYFLALIVAGLTLGLLGGQIFAEGLEAQYGDIVSSSLTYIAGIITFALSLYPALTILPSVIGVVIGEIGHIRSILYYLIAGGLSGVAIPVFYALADPANFNLPSQAFLAAFATAGFAGGLTYWAIAGRSA